MNSTSRLRNTKFGVLQDTTVSLSEGEGYPRKPHQAGGSNLAHKK